MPHCHVPRGGKHLIKLAFRHAAHNPTRLTEQITGRFQLRMKLAAYKFYFAFRGPIERQDVQNMVEYALIVALIVLEAAAGLSVLASVIKQASGAMAMIL